MELTDPVDAVAFGLVLAVTASSAEQAAEALVLTERISATLTQAELDTAKARAEAALAELEGLV